jgi:AcrR family transcriptional regulator
VHTSPAEFAPARGADPDSDTTRRIIAAASEEFALRGYAGARVRNIVQAARVNLAAVNYYYGGKLGLYRATLRHLARQGGAAPASDRRRMRGEDRLHGAILSLLERYLGEEQPSALGRVLGHEAMNPTDHLDRLIEATMRPEVEHIGAIVRELAESAPSPEDLRRATLSVISQCLFPVLAGRALERLYPAAAHETGQWASLARHITDFSLPGIRALRRGK